MSHNQYGHLFRVTSWGESHGPAIGCVIDGCPPRIELDENDIQQELDRRRPGQSRYTTQRQEGDAVKIYSGIMSDDHGTYRTSGTPIALIIENQDQRSKDYSAIKDSFRPGHADYTYEAKYGLRDYRGGGRSSARETACRVAAGAIARKIIAPMQVRGALIQIGEKGISRENWDWRQVNNNPFFCPDAAAVPIWAEYLDDIRKNGLSVGAIIELEATGVYAGLGAPLYAKLDQDIASALMSINAVKGVEIGNGFAAAGLNGVQNSDEMRADAAGNISFLSNHAGGILGGISNGMPIIARFAVKPTSSILKPRRSINKRGENIDVVTKGRHDPCVGIRAVPVGEAMLAAVLADHLLRDRAQNGERIANAHPLMQTGQE